ncbi:MAG: radical SAM family heme chaperone HemW [Chitinophagaceae bacterium]
MSGIYIHIPFCKKACHYCNFHFSTTLNNKADLVNAMRKEIRLVAARDQQVSTIYVGGGTPSLLSAEELKTLLDEVSNAFIIEKGAEITLEANPDDINNEQLIHWREAGINRLSIGIQSFFNEHLQWMNRAHNAQQAFESIRQAKAAGFDNFSIDLIYGSPTLSDAQWKQNIETVINLEVPHISSYALTVEKGTALDLMIQKKKARPVTEEKQARHFLLLMEWMAEAGYEHYEISNFAKPGKRSRHNSSYWNGSAYLGIGPSAHSFDGKSRSWNIANNALYTKQIEGGVLPAEKETLSKVQRLNEFIMTTIRTIEGVDIARIKNDFGEEAGQNFLIKAGKYIDRQKCFIHDGHIILTREGKLFADGIAADLFFEEGELD